jgi:hypothetical protein
VYRPASQTGRKANMTNLDEQYVGKAITVKGHTFLTRYDTDNNLYEHDVCCDKWYKFVETVSKEE